MIHFLIISIFTFSVCGFLATFGVLTGFCYNLLRKIAVFIYQSEQIKELLDKKVDCKRDVSETDNLKNDLTGLQIISGAFSSIPMILLSCCVYLISKSVKDEAKNLLSSNLGKGVFCCFTATFFGSCLAGYYLEEQTDYADYNSSLRDLSELKKKIDPFPKERQR